MLLVDACLDGGGGGGGGAGNEGAVEAYEGCRCAGLGIDGAAAAGLSGGDLAGNEGGAGGGGGGGAAGDARPNAFRAAVSAKDGSRDVPFVWLGGGGGKRFALGKGGAGGGFGALEGGGRGGADGGAGLVDTGGGGGAEGSAGVVDGAADGFRLAGGGMGGFFPIGGGGFGFESAASGRLAVDVGRRLLFNAATLGGRGAAFDGGNGGAPPGGLNPPPFGAGGGGAAGVLGAEDFLELVSGSESYMFTPPALFRNFGMPPANRPPNWGAVSVADAAAAAPPALFEPWSLLLRALFPPGGAGGRKPAPGTGGAPPTGGATFEDDLVSIMGADRSLICVTFFSRAPFSMSPNRAPCRMIG